MTKREYERVPSSLVVKFLIDKSVCYGIVTNISEKGMCIKSGTFLPCDSQVNLKIPFKDSQMEIPVRVMRLEQTNGFYDIMGVELTKVTKRYLKIVNTFKMVL